MTSFPGILPLVDKTFNALNDLWEHRATHQIVGSGLVVVFVVALAAIEMGRRGLLPPGLAAHVPRSHFYAVNLAFTLLLAFEVLALVFSLSRSMSISVGKQFEILSLILLRKSFKYLTEFGEPIELTGHMDALLKIMVDGAGALAIFVIIGLYYRVVACRRATASCELERRRFVILKKLTALVLLAVFAWLGLTRLPDLLLFQDLKSAFEGFYTVLIFADILIMLLSLRYQPGFPSVFRNSGFALSALMVRLSLAAPAFYDVGIGVAAALFALALAWFYNHSLEAHQAGLDSLDRKTGETATGHGDKEPASHLAG